MEPNMKTLKALREEMRAFNLDTDEELDLDALADIDLDSILGGELDDGTETGYTPLDFNDEDLGGMNLDDFVDDEDLGGEDNELDGYSVDGEMGDLTPDGGTEGETEDLSLDGDLTDDEIASLGDEETIGDEENELPLENPDFQGEIRTVKGGNLVFKRKNEDGNFDELWIYNVGNDIKRETRIRRAILAGTDIDPGKQESKDGTQRAETTTTGNVQFLHITGLPQ